ncbi:pentapeptide repeat-containing protein [Actinoplanes sp. NPDC051851]|uniref:WD40 domain-containing protein n=1 Tax=Actinoplanes sp. NPDC051851 TaxID=3154753 RepID=UPI00341DFCFB
MPPITILHCRDLLTVTRSLPDGTHSLPGPKKSINDRLRTIVGDNAPQLVIVTGNLAERATSAEYDLAYQALEALRDTLGLPPERVVLVPGSSDVNRLKCQAYFLQCAADEAEPAAPYWEKWQPFSTLLRRFHGADLPKDQPWTISDHPGPRVVVAGLNSTMALTHRPGDENGCLGAEQLAWFAEQLSTPERRDWLRIGVLHHRPDGDVHQLTDGEHLAGVLGPHLDLLVHGQQSGPEVALLGPDEVPVLGTAHDWQLIEAYPDRIRTRRLPPAEPTVTGPILLPHPPPRSPAPRSIPPEPPSELRRLAERVAEVCRLRQHGADVALIMPPDATPAMAYLRISPDPSRGDRGPAEQHPVGVCAGTPARADVDWFVTVLARFRTNGSGRTANLVHAGEPAGDELRAWAHARDVDLITFSDFQLGPDLDRFAEHQAALLDGDPVYPSASYVPQRYTEFLSETSTPSEAAPSTDLLAWLRGWVDAPSGRLVVVLGTFGHGKTFLLRELAQRMAADGSRAVPVLIDLRNFEKAYSLDELVAVQLSRHGQRQIDLDAFRYLRREGRVALFFDGFDELATRVSYDRATNHLDTIVQAAEEHAKVIVTSRDQHFLTDADVLNTLGAQLGADRRVIRLADFDDHQILVYLTHQLRDPESARARLDLLRDIKDLLGLSRNPRMLGFITDLGEEQLLIAGQAGSRITAADLYRQVLDRWLGHETRRLRRLGPGAPDEEDLLDAVTHLALRLWDSPDDSLSLDDLGAAAATLTQLTATTVGRAATLEPQESAHLLGSSTLLVRSGNQRFTFVHHSVREWLIANHLAAQLAAGSTGVPGLVGRSMSPLMIDFLCGLAGSDTMRSWAEQILAGQQPIARGAGRNAVEVLRHLRMTTSSPLHMPGFDLRGQDFSARFLTGADLSRADLTGANLNDTDLTNAKLTGANLTGARMHRASLLGADLSGAEMSGARLLGTDLTGATLTGVRMRRTALVATTGVDAAALREIDTLGAALPGNTTAEPQIASATVVHAVTVASGVRLLAGACADGTVRIWDAVNGTPLRAMTGHTGPLRAAAYTADGRYLASAGDDEVVRIWDTATGHAAQTLTEHTGRIRAVAYGPDGRHLASAGDDETVRIWDTTTGQTVHLLTEHAGRLRALAYSPDGRHLASAGDDETVRIWDTTTGQTVHLLIGHTGAVHALSFGPSGDLIASASDDRKVYVWNVADQAIVHRLTGHTGWIRAVAFSPEGRRLASAGDDGTVRIWDSATGQNLYTLTGHTGTVHSLAYYRDGRQLASTGDDRTIRVWDTGDGRLNRTLRGGGGASRAVSFSAQRDDPWLAVGAEDGSVQIWNAVIGTPPQVLSEPTGPDAAITALVVARGGHHLAAASRDGVIRVWNPATTALELTLTGHIGRVNTLALDPEGRILASGGTDGTVRIWDITSKSPPRTLVGQHGSVTTVSFTPEGGHLAAGGTDGTIRVWHLATERRQTMAGHTNTIRALAVSPDGRHLASADDDGTIQIRSTGGRPPRVLAGHGSAITALAFAPDGEHLASAGTAGVIHIWATATGRLENTLAGDSGWIRSLSWTPDGVRLASAGGDRGVRIWEPAHPSPRAVLVPLSVGGSAVLFDDQRYVLQGRPEGEYWYAMGMCRFEPGELDPHLTASRPVPPGGRLW